MSCALPLSGATGQRPGSRQCPVAYARSLGVHLERLEVGVCPPCMSLAAWQLHVAFCVHRVQAPLQPPKLTGLELDRTSLILGLRNSLIDRLIRFLHRGSSKLASLYLNRMQNNMSHVSATPV